MSSAQCYPMKNLFFWGLLISYNCLHAQFCNFQFNNYNPGISYYNNIPFNLALQIDSMIVNWGDGYIEHLSNPGQNDYHQYCNCGTYNISISVFNNGIYNCSANYQAVITYTALMNHTLNGNTVNFNTYQGTNYFWEFGDGTTLNTNTNNVSHTYLTNGVFYPKVTFDVYNANAACNMVCTGAKGFDTVTITNAPCNLQSSFWAYKNGLDVNFSNLTTCPNCASQSFEWSFGDGSPNSILLNPSHTYANVGLYQACLYASGIDSLQNTCTDTFCLDIVFNYPNLVLDEKPNTINIFPNPVHHQLFIVNTSNFPRELYNSIGRLVFTTLKNEIDVSNYAKGMYYLKVGEQVKKITIQ